VFTIHNLAYQGNFPRAVIDEIGLPPTGFTIEGFEFFGEVSFLKAGIVHSDQVTTVSPRYAKEILTPEFGCGLEGVLQSRPDRLSGILNGIDRAEHDPANDPALPRGFSDRDLDGKAVCKKELLKTFGIPVPEGRVPVIGMVTRLTEQKGIDLVLEAMPRLLEGGALLVVLGNGEARYEDALRKARVRYPKKLGVKIGFDEKLSRLVFGGSDLYLMPSRFEPCGLAQLYALRYGAVPVVRAVGGLDDTVSDAKAFGEIVRRGMRADFSWSRSAAEYEALFRAATVRERSASTPHQVP
jgi:starch synthase